MEKFFKENDSKEMINLKKYYLQLDEKEKERLRKLAMIRRWREV